ncbi:hypothetical protein [Dyadobacter sp. CY323]|uniref:hypothetical protein n=1 Tax=Dyadobacter sp. CY323 TaxID=2907302 RepID=UPI001F42BF7C|nr:hypothetical protein [Dyadobacter sp. CY323]MCE6993063.1 hypothetical protein [Dyadobacter sp. CY323]
MTKKLKSLNQTLDELPNEKLSEIELVALLANLTGYVYTFANTSHQRWGRDGKIKKAGDKNPAGFFQIMPDKSDDGFFEWYCDNRIEYQFFRSKNKAVLHFIFYWIKWSKEIKPTT